MKSFNEEYMQSNTEHSQEYVNIIDMTLPELVSLMEEIGQKKFRASQLYEWIHVKNAASYDEMTNLSRDLRARLEAEYPLRLPVKETVQISKIDGTRKYLFRMYDGNYVESVLMMYHHGNSVCISSQVGCRMGCSFCASTIGGLTRNLTAGEMLGQIYAIERDFGQRISNVVVMGTGEPLDNYENVVRFIRMLTDADGHNIRSRASASGTASAPPSSGTHPLRHWRVRGTTRRRDDKIAPGGLRTKGATSCRLVVTSSRRPVRRMMHVFVF